MSESAFDSRVETLRELWLELSETSLSLSQAASHFINGEGRACDSGSAAGHMSRTAKCFLKIREMENLLCGSQFAQRGPDKEYVTDAAKKLSGMKEPC